MVNHVNNKHLSFTSEPRALFLAFGDSSLNFDLRVWIGSFDDKLLVTSELNQDIESEFTDHGIVILFPQRDLHVISEDGDIVSSLTP